MSQESPWLKDIPSPKKILKEALTKLSFRDPSKITAMKPHKVITVLEKTCHEIYSEHEEHVREKFSKGRYGKFDTREFETSLANSRKVRAGVTLELIFRHMLDLLSIPYKSGVEIGEAEADFVVPDMETLKKNKKSAVLISLKRKVRERWKLTVGDAYILREIYGYPNNVWFVSLYEPPLDAVKVFLKLHIRIYVPDDVYASIRNKILKDFAKDELDRLRKFSQVFDDLKPFATSVQMRLDELK